MAVVVVLAIVVYNKLYTSMVMADRWIKLCTKQFGLESVVSSRDFLMVPIEVHEVFYINHINPINKPLSHAIQLFSYNDFIFLTCCIFLGRFWE